ncbi:MAG: tyrosine phosphatase family protein [Rhizobiaceae bacterium]
MIYVTPMSQLPRIVSQSGASHLITLLTAGSDFDRPPEIDRSRHLHLTMHDITDPRPGLTPPAENHVQELLEFAAGWDRQSALVINCYAGISRSTAAAYVICCAIQPERDECELARVLREKSPSATPNSLIVSHGDRLLGRQRRMECAIAEIGRGAEAFEGEPFCLEV